MNEILVCNCGSSSVKIDIFSIQKGIPKFLAAATASRVKTPACEIKLKIQGQNDATIMAAADLDHEQVILKISKLLEDKQLFLPMNRMAVGHRIVHGAHFIKDPVLLDSKNIEIVKKCAEYAPLHNPVNLEGIFICEKIFTVKQVGVFDTAFHHTIPEPAFTYALPQEFIKKYNIRRYGFHGSSHEYVARKAAAIIEMDFENIKCISLHLGNGASACAISHGKSIETSMGFTPLEGLVMGTRCGDLDPALVGIICEKENLTWDDIDNLMNKDSGLKGICGKSDMRDILSDARNGNKSARLARDIFVHRIKKYIGSYLAVLNGADAIIFTGGIGENSTEIRNLCLSDLDNLNIFLDEQKNRQPDLHNHAIHKANSRTQILVIPTDEEWMIANKTYQLTNNSE